MHEQSSSPEHAPLLPLSRNETDARYQALREQLREWIANELENKMRREAWSAGGREGTAPTYNPHAELINPERVPEWEFDMWDKVNTGTLTPEEWDAYTAQWRQAHDAAVAAGDEVLERTLGAVRGICAGRVMVLFARRRK